MTTGSEPDERDAIERGDNVYNPQRGKSLRCNHSIAY
jgi:hypothetical protein